MKLTFLGATETVTGSKYLLETSDRKILVDCGLFQGYKKLRLKNWESFPIPPSNIDAILLTHAHIDHSGYLPLMTKQNFKNTIYSTPATQALCKILLPDSGYLQEEAAHHANKFGYSKHKPALPLYTKEEAIECLNYFQGHPYGQPLDLSPDLSCTFSRAGHILGASMIQIRKQNTSVLFSGDLGRLQDPIMYPPAMIEQADYLVLESTYGNKVHVPESPLIRLEKIITKTVKQGGSVIIPAFAIGRAQTILYCLHQLLQNNKIPEVPIYLDSPMAESATDVFQTFHKEHRLSSQQSQAICSIARHIKTPEESKTINKINYPIIVISASGMIAGGRILHHIKNFASNHRNTILFTGFQAAGTRGARILAGERSIKIHGNEVPIRAKVEYISNMSSHADSEEILTWLRHFRNPPSKVYITHGEPKASEALRKKIETELGWECHIPKYMETQTL